MTEPNLPDNAEILLYGTEDGAVKVDVLYRDESFWLTQKRMAELFGADRTVITKHLKNIFETNELKQESVCARIAHTAADGKTYRTQYYNLDAIIAVGYRVNSRQATQFRIWAIHGHTAAELIRERVDSTKPYMGLMTWKNAPKGKVLKSDVSVAKNYLNQQELDELNHIVVMYLDYAELQGKKQRLMKMADWAEKLDAFLRFNDYEILDNPGRVSAKVAKELAEQHYEAFRVDQDKGFESDFDRLVKHSAKAVKRGKKGND